MMDKYEIDRSMLGNCWQGDGFAFEMFCNILQDNFPNEEIMPMPNGRDNVHNTKPDTIPNDIWESALNDHCDLYPEAWGI